MPVIDINHMMEHADKIKNKAMFKLEQNLAGPLNSMFGEADPNKIPESLGAGEL